MPISVVVCLYPLNQKWFWQLFLTLLFAMLVPLIIFYVVIMVSPSSIIIVLIVAVLVWVIVRSYRRWVESENAKKDVECESNPQV